MSNEANASAYPTDPSMLSKGLTKREYIATLALAATNSTAKPQERAQEAVVLADALLAILHSESH